MDQRDHHRDADPTEAHGVMQKAADLSSLEITEEHLAAINKFTLKPLTAEDVFVFKAVLCDNEVDRVFDRFTVKALEDMRALFVGRTVIKDHSRRSDGQIARIYHTELETGVKMLASGEPYTKLVAYCYMVKTAGNADLIAEINGGIRKEGSVGFSPSAAICSICGTDNTKSYCSHWPGRKYAKDSGETLCTFTLTGVRDAYEFSLVAVPAQRAAGVSKSYMGDPAVGTSVDTDGERTKKLTLRARAAEAKVKNNNF